MQRRAEGADAARGTRPVLLVAFGEQLVRVFDRSVRGDAREGAAAAPVDEDFDAYTRVTDWDGDDDASDGDGDGDGAAGATGATPEANVLPQRGGAVLLLGWRR